MSIAWVNGSLSDITDAVVPMEDRGHQFGDGVYEVIAYFNRKLVDGQPHLERLQRSLAEIRIVNPYSLQDWQQVIAEVIAQNPYEHGGLYLQVTRGTAKRDHGFPSSVQPNITLTAFAAKTPARELTEQGVSVITTADLRWKRCDIKTICLLPNVLAKQQAVEAGAREAWLLKENDLVTEGAISNAFIVKNGTIITHPATNEILCGITRNAVLEMARKNEIGVEERPFSLAEAKTADEAFLSSTTSNVLAISRIDGQSIGSGKAGPITTRLLNLYIDYIERQTGHRIW